jgi:hypothetical protein
MSICPAYFQLGLPIYSANSVRFRMGHLKRPKDFKDLGSSVCEGELPYPADDMFQWTYTSPEFPMAQVRSSAISCFSFYLFFFFFFWGGGGGGGGSGLRELFRD